MLQQIAKMVSKTPGIMGQIIKFFCLTGLRPSEAVDSVGLINDKKEFANHAAKNFKTLATVYYIQALPLAFWSFVQIIVPRITLIQLSNERMHKNIMSCRVTHHTQIVYTITIQSWKTYEEEKKLN
jgi:hypothetical protein